MSSSTSKSNIFQKITHKNGQKYPSGINKLNFELLPETIQINQNNLFTTPKVSISNNFQNRPSKKQKVFDIEDIDSVRVNLFGNDDSVIASQR